jgi:hypothetical protein
MATSRMITRRKLLIGAVLAVVIVVAVALVT